MFATVPLFFTKFSYLLGCALLILPVWVSAKIDIRPIKGLLVAFLIFALCSVVFATFYNYDHPNQTVLFKISPLTATNVGFVSGLLLGFRSLIPGLVALILICTTDPASLAKVMMKMHIPLSVAFMMMGALKMFPLVSSEMQNIKTAQIIRGVEYGNMRKNFKAFRLAAFPLIVNSLRKSRVTGTAVECKGFGKRAWKECYQSFSFTRVDYIVLAFCVLFAISAIVIRYGFGLGVDAYVTSVYLQPADGVTLVLPYLGFCGDWTDGVVFEGDPETNYLLQPTLFGTTMASGVGYYLGENAYNNEDRYNYDRLAFSPVIDNIPQYFATIASLRRNVTDFEMAVYGSDNQKVWNIGADLLRKTFYYPGYGLTVVQQMMGWTGRYYNEETGEYDGDFAPSGWYSFKLSGNVAQCEEGYTEKVFPFWLDAGGPTVDNIQCFVDEDGVFKLAFDVQDDHYVRLVEIIDSTSSYLLTYTNEDFAEVEPQGSKSKVILDLDGLCQFLADNGLNPGRIKLSVSDYALNHTDVYVDLGPQFLSMSNKTIAVGDSQQAELRILPARLEDTLELTWSSADETIATVDQTGLVTGVAEGETTISARADTGLTATAKVTVGDETLPPETPETPDPDARVMPPAMIKARSPAL